MSDRSPQSPGLSRGARVALALASLAILAYSVVIAGQILLGVLACVLVLGIPLAYRLVGAVFRFAAAAERIADALETLAEGETGSRGPRNAASRSDDADADRSRDHLEDRW